MPMGMATDIVYSAALKHCEKFANSSGVECRLADLKHPESLSQASATTALELTSAGFQGHFLRPTFALQDARVALELPQGYAFQIPS